jgi:hypothetical protein
VLNPAEETRQNFAESLTILGRHLAERADVMESVDADPILDRPAYAVAVAHIHAALDTLDLAIEVLQGESA